MLRLRLVAALLTAALLTGTLAAADPPALVTATGVIDKVEKDALTLRPRSASGKFEKEVKLKLTGTTKITTLRPQNRGGTVVLTQQDTDAGDLKPKQTVAVIYTMGPSGPVLLSAVVQPAASK